MDDGHPAAGPAAVAYRERGSPGLIPARPGHRNLAGAAGSLGGKGASAYSGVAGKGLCDGEVARRDLRTAPWRGQRCLGIHPRRGKGASAYKGRGFPAAEY